MFWNVGSQLGQAALLYTGLSVLPDVASAIGKGAVAAIQSVLPASNTYSVTYNYTNPVHLGSKIDTRA